MARTLPLQWQDPSQWVFMCAASFIRGLHCFLRYMGAYCVVAGMMLILLVGGLFLYAIIPIMAETTLELMCHAGVATILLFHIYFNYALCCATDPGFITTKWKVEADVDDPEVTNVSDNDETKAALDDEKASSKELDKVEEELLPRIRPRASTVDEETNGEIVRLSRVQRIDPQGVARQRGGDGSSYCRRCRHFRPRRAHHCSVCNRCIAHYDHHCPWVNNCIGRNNYRYFFSFLVWLGVGAFYAAYMSYSAAYMGLSQEQFTRLFVIFESRSASMILTAVCSLSFSTGVAVSILATWHAFLIATAQTTVEWHMNRRASNKCLYDPKVASPYSRGSIHGNWELVFGHCTFKILSLLPSTRLPPNPQTLYKKTTRGAKDDAKDATFPDTIV